MPNHIKHGWFFHWLLTIKRLFDVVSFDNKRNTHTKCCKSHHNSLWLRTREREREITDKRKLLCSPAAAYG